MEKPITIKIDELKKELINRINESDLPLFVLEPILKDLYIQIQEIGAHQLEQDKTDYNNSLLEKDNVTEEVIEK